MKSCRILLITCCLLFVSFSLYGLKPPLPGALATAVSAGDLREVDSLLSQGADPDQPDSTGQTALLYAVNSGRYDLVARMLATTADPNKPGRDGLSPLMAAVKVSREDLVILLLSAGANPNLIYDMSGPHQPEGKVAVSSLSLAINRGDFNLARRLFDSGADPMRLKGPVEIQYDPLNLPSLNVPLDLRIWQDLAEIRDSANSPDWNNSVSGNAWVLHRAAAGNDWTGARDALDSGTPVDSADERGVTPMMVAAWHGHTSLVALYLQRGANPDAMDNRGRGALAYAAAAGETSAIAGLLSAPSFLETEKTGYLDELRQSPVYYGLIANQPLAVNAFLDAGIPAEAVDSEGISLLMIAAWLGDLRSVTMLLSVADPSVRDYAGRSALAWSAAAFDRDRTAGRESGDKNRGDDIYPVARRLADWNRNPLIYSTQPTSDMKFGEFDASVAWSPGRNSAEAAVLRQLKPSPVPTEANDGDLTLYRIFRDEEPGIPSSD